MVEESSGVFAAGIFSLFLLCCSKINIKMSIAELNKACNNFSKFVQQILIKKFVGFSYLYFESYAV